MGNGDQTKNTKTKKVEKLVFNQYLAFLLFILSLFVCYILNTIRYFLEYRTVLVTMA